MTRRVITISREFGSGGREFGKRMADTLGIAYYDREIITAVAEKSGLAEAYIESVSESGVGLYYPLTLGNTLAYESSVVETQLEVMSQQRNLLLELAEKGDCVIVGRSANVVLKEYNPLNFFIYADLASKVDRCRARAPEGENISDADLRRMISKVDRERARSFASVSDIKWGDKSAYHLCVNTSGRNIKELVEALIPYVNTFWTE